jgi:glyoxylase-like metal-dependent hydrolase (beta-lactamase superfamily II)
MIYTIKNKIFPSNTYVVSGDKECVIIDPGLDTDKILSAITESGLSPVAVLATHGHFDHIGSAENLKQRYNIPFYIHANDVKIMKSANFLLKVAKIEHRILTPTPTHIIEAEEMLLKIEGFEFEIKNYSGHTDGSCVIRHKDNLFTGDIIFAKQFVFNSFPGEDLSKLRKTILKIYESYPSELMVYPGHGAMDTLANIQNNNKELSAFLNQK